MDLTLIDNLIERLEKKKSLRPGSPPVVLNGHLGVWRTIRHNRMFIEIGKNKKLGRVLIGPPSFVGLTLDDVPGKAWQNLTPRATLKEFKNVKVADNGIDTLKESIKNAVGPDDTRREAVEDKTTVQQLVPIARSAGFADEEIKSALSGKPPNKPLDEISDRRTSEDLGDVPDNVVQFKPSPKPAADKPEVKDDSGPRELPKPDAKKIEDNNAYINDTLARIPEAVKGTSGDDRDKSVADFLDKVIADRLDKDPQETLMSRRIRDLADGLRAGKYNVRDVEKEIKELTTSRNRIKERQLEDKERKALKDAVEVKEFIDNFEAKLDQKITEKVADSNKQFKPSDKVSESRIRELVEETKRQGEEAVREAVERRKEMERLRQDAARERARAQEFMSDAQKARMEVDAALEMLSELVSQIDNKEVKKEVREVMESVRVSPFSRRSILLRLYQLLQLLLMLVPFL